MNGPGLEEVVAAETAVSRVDGEAGRLWFRGRPVEEVAPGGFESTAALVLGRPLEGLGEARVRAWARQHVVAASGPPVERLRSLFAGASVDRAEDLVAELGVGVALASGALLPPDPQASHAADLFRMLRGRPGSEAEIRALGTYLGTVMDHGLNASTFTARVIASTGADGVSCVLGALGALSGPLHGGAPGPVLDMLDAVEHPERAEAWVGAALARGERIMGMGHRVYRVRDPRARALESALSGLSTERLALARAVEQAAERALAVRHPTRPLRANVEFYTAILLEALGFDRSLFTPLFAAGRVVGWLAHVEEQRAVGRLIRPRARYVGPPCQAPAATRMASSA